MTDATPIQITLTDPLFFFHLHRATFAEPTSSRANASYARTEDAVSDAKAFEFTPPLDILLKRLESGYEVVKPIRVKIKQVNNNFIASFVEANVNASGETWDEAVSNLTSLVIDKFDMLLAHRANALGPAPRKQLSVLQSYIRRATNVNQRARA